MARTDEIAVRWMIRRDFAEVLRIEHEAFEFPWLEEDFTQTLRRRNCIGMVAVLRGNVVGFAVYELHKHCVHVQNFAVDPQHWRCGVGRAMIAHLQKKLTPAHKPNLLLEVRETNLAAQLFFRAMGFSAVRILRDFYQDAPDDAYLMQCTFETVPLCNLRQNDDLPRRLAGAGGTLSTLERNAANDNG